MSLLSILTYLNYVAVWIISARPPTSSPFTLLTKPLRIVPSAPITIGITITIIAFFVLWQGPNTWLSFRFLWFSFCSPLGRHSSLFSRFFFLLALTKSSLLAGIRWSVCISKYQRLLCVSFISVDLGFGKYHLAEWSNHCFLHNSQWITFPAQLYLVLYSFYANLVHWLYHYHFTHLRILFTSVSRWFSTGG